MSGLCFVFRLCATRKISFVATCIGKRVCEEGESGQDTHPDHGALEEEDACHDGQAEGAGEAAGEPVPRVWHGAAGVPPAGRSAPPLHHPCPADRMYCMLYIGACSLPLLKACHNIMKSCQHAAETLSLLAHALLSHAPSIRHTRPWQRYDTCVQPFDTDRQVQIALTHSDGSIPKCSLTAMGNNGKYGDIVQQRLTCKEVMSLHYCLPSSGFCLS